MSGSRRHDEFSDLLRQHYGRVYGYILSLVHSPEDAYDVFQETAITLWEKFDQFQPDRCFGAWACGVARLKVLEHLKALKRRRRAVFSEQLIETLTALQEDDERFAERRAALAHCLQQLTARQRELLLRCYGAKHSVRELARELGRTTHSIYSSLRHLRVKLLICIDQQLGTEGAP